MNDKEIALALTQVICGGGFQYDYENVMEVFNKAYKHLKSLPDSKE